MLFPDIFKDNGFFKYFGGLILLTALIIFCSVAPVYATEVDDVPSIDDLEGVMLLIEYEANTPVQTVDGDVYYIPSLLLNDFRYVVVMPNYKKIFFYNDYFFGSGSITYIGGSAYGDEYFTGLCSINMADAVSGNLVEVMTYQTQTQVVSSVRGSSYFNHDIKTGDFTIPAKLTIVDVISYLLSFDTGYDDIIVDSVSTDENGIVTSLPVPSVAPNGFNFDGWYLDEELTQSVDETYVFTSNSTLYAKWSELPTGSIDEAKVEAIVVLLEYILGILIFFIVIVLCKYVYSFFNMFL